MTGPDQPERASGRSLTDLVDSQLREPPPIDPVDFQASPPCFAATDIATRTSSYHIYFTILGCRTARPSLHQLRGQRSSYPKLRKYAPALPFVSADYDVIQVGHGQPPRYDLLILDSNYEGEATSQTLSRSVVRGVVGRLRDDRGIVFDDQMRFLLFQMFAVRDVFGVVDEIANTLEEIAEFQEFGIVMARRPRLESTGCVSPAVRISMSTGATSTAGFFARPPNADFVIITTANHAVAEDAQVSVAGRPGSILHRSDISDSCLISVPTNIFGEEDSLVAIAQDFNLHGVLTRPPRNPAPGVFDGATSGLCQTVIRAHDPSVALNQMNFATKVYTDSDTNEGDSGALLFDEDGMAVGVAAWRTAYGSDPAYAIWIWASQVLATHHINHYLH